MMTVTAHYQHTGTVMNVLDDLINHGIEREKIFADDANHEVKVMVPEVIEDEICEILNRHHPV